MRLECRVEKKYKTSIGTAVVELLLAACLLSVALVPLFYILRFTKLPVVKSESDFMATLLAHHAVETIVAQNLFDPKVLPTITGDEPVVVKPYGYRYVSPYFREILNHWNGLEEADNPVLFWAMKQFSCNVDTYYLEDNLFKAIVYIDWEERGRPKRIFLERLLDHPPHRSTLEEGE